MMKDKKYYYPYLNNNHIMEFDPEIYGTDKSMCIQAILHSKLFVIAMLKVYQNGFEELLSLQIPQIPNLKDRCKNDYIENIYTTYSDLIFTLASNGRSIIAYTEKFLDFELEIIYSDFYESESCEEIYKEHFSDMLAQMKMLDLSGEGCVDLHIYKSRKVGKYLSYKKSTPGFSYKYDEEIMELIRNIQNPFVVANGYSDSVVVDGVFYGAFLAGEANDYSYGYENTDMYLPLYCLRLTRLIEKAIKDFSLE